MSPDPHSTRSTPDVLNTASDHLQSLQQKRFGRRRFLRQAGLAGAAAMPAAAVVAEAAQARSRHRSNAPTQGDFALLRFLSAAEIIETDLWVQYAAFGGANDAPRRPSCPRCQPRR